MKRKKRTLYATVGVLAAMSVFTATAFASVQNASGYERFKNAALNTIQNQTNFTLEAEFGVAIDNKVMNHSKIATKYNGESSMSSESIDYYDRSDDTLSNDSKMYWSSTIVDGDKTGSLFDNEYTDGKSYENETWDVRENYYNHSGMSYSVFGISGSPAQMKFAEALLDLFVGDAKNYVITNGNKVTANLDKNKIPEIAQLAVAAMIEANARDSHEGIPIVKDAFISSVVAEGTFNGETIEDVKFKATVEGKGKDNSTHEISLDINMSFSDIGTTVPETLEGKKTMLIERNYYDIKTEASETIIYEMTDSTGTSRVNVMTNIESGDSVLVPVDDIEMPNIPKTSETDEAIEVEKNENTNESEKAEEAADVTEAITETTEEATDNEEDAASEETEAELTESETEETTEAEETI